MSDEPKEEIEIDELNPISDSVNNSPMKL